MKQNTNKLILISGDLASGKSTFSKELSKQINVPVFNKDNIKEILGDVIGFKDREENLKLSVATFEIFEYMSKTLMKSNITYILESNFRSKELEKLKTLSIENNYEIITFVLQADIGVLHKRFMDRINSGTRNKVHMSVDLSNYSDFEKLIKVMRMVEYPGRVYRIDTTQFNIDYNEIKRLIDNEKI